MNTYEIPTLQLQNTNFTGYNKSAHYKHNKGSWKLSAEYIP